MHTSAVDGINYYRLTQYDLDGQYEYSHIISITIEDEGNFIISPNPVNKMVHITTEDFQEGTIAKIVNTNGATVKTIVLQNRITPVYTEELSPGLYIIVIDQHGKQVQKRMIISRD